MEIGPDLRDGRELVTGVVWGKRPVGDALDEEPLAPDAEELPVNADHHIFLSVVAAGACAGAGFETVPSSSRGRSPPAEGASTPAFT